MPEEFVIVIDSRYHGEPVNYLVNDPTDGIFFTILVHRATRFPSEKDARSFISKKLRKRDHYRVAPFKPAPRSPDQIKPLSSHNDPR